jgi:hypothetical protein
MTEWFLAAIGPIICTTEDICDPRKTRPYSYAVLPRECTHANCTTRNLGRCYNEYTCTDCGYTWTIDSSD